MLESDTISDILVSQKTLYSGKDMFAEADITQSADANQENLYISPEYSM